MDVRTEKTTNMKENEMKLDSLLQQRKKRKFNPPDASAKRLKNNKNDEKEKDSISTNGKTVSVCDGKENNKILTRSRKSKIQIPVTSAQENTDTKVQYNAKDKSCKTETKENGLSLISHNVIKSLDKVLFEEDTDELISFSSTDADTHNCNKNDINSTSLSDINKTDCNFKETENKLENLGSDTEVFTPHETINDPITSNQVDNSKEKLCTKQGNVTDKVTDIFTDILNSVEIEKQLENMVKTVTEKSEKNSFDEKPIKSEKVEIKNENRYIEQSQQIKDRITEFSNTVSPTMEELKDNIGNVIIHDLLTCKINIKNASDSEINFSIISPAKYNPKYKLRNNSDELCDKIEKSKDYTIEKGNLETKNDCSQLQISTTAEETTHTHNEKSSQNKLELKILHSTRTEDCNDGEKTNYANNMKCENFTSNGTIIDKSKTREDKVKEQKPIFSIFSGIDSLDENLKKKEEKLSVLDRNDADNEKILKGDENETIDLGIEVIGTKPTGIKLEYPKKTEVVAENLKEKEKKLSLLYMNALDYEKQFKTDKTDLRDDQNEILNTELSTAIHKNFTETGSVENILHTPTACDKDEKDIKISINLEEKQDSPEHEYPSKLDIKHLNLDNAEELYSEKNVNKVNLLEVTDKASDFKYENPNLNSLIYDKFSMKSIDGDLFQINSEMPMQEYISVADMKSNSIDTNLVTKQKEVLHDSEEISMKNPINNDSMYTIEDKTLLEVSEIQTKLKNTNELQKHFEDSDMTFLVTARDCFKKAEINISPTEVSSTHSSTDTSIETTKKEKYKPFYDPEDCFDMDDDFTLTASQLSMIETDEKNQVKTTTETKNSGQQTENCSRTNFGMDSLAVEVVDQLCYIRESVESIKILLHTALKKD